MNSLLRLLVTGTLVTVPVGAAAQDAVAVVRSDVRITPESMARPVVQPMVAAHPTDPDRLIGIAIRTFHDRRWVPEQDCISFRSDDGGSTWTTAPLPSIQCGDPWVAYGPDGAAWGVLVARASADTTRSSLFVYRLAPDAGAHEWEQVAILPFGDHPTIAVDTTAGPYHGTVYVAANRVLRNVLGRRHFGVVVWRLRPDSNGFQQTGVAHALNLNVNSDNPVILPDGRLVVPFDDFMRDVDDFRGGGRLESKRTWLLISDDGGGDFLEPVLVSESCGSGFDYMDIGRIEPEPHLYHVCLGRDGRSVLLHSSRDGGLRWTAPTVIGRGGIDSKGAAGVAANR